MPGLTYTIAELLKEQGRPQANALREQARLRAEAQRASGSGWANAVAGAGQYIASIPAQKQQAQKQAAAAELEALKAQDLRGEIADKAKARQKAEAFQAELAKYNDIEEALPHLYQIDPMAASGIAKHVAESKSEALKFQAQILSTERAKADFIHAKLSTDDPGQYAKNLYTLEKAMPDRDWSAFSGDPAKDKAAIDGLLSEATTAKEKIDARMKAIDDARMAASQQSTEQHQRTMEQITAGNTAADNERQAKALSEQARHNRVMEARPVGGGIAASGSDVKETVAGMKDGTLPPQLPGRATKEYNAIMAEAHRQGFDLARAATDWQATQKHVATLNGAQQTRMAQAIDNASHSLDVIEDLANQWDGGKFPILNKVTLASAKNGVLGPKAQQIATKLEAQIADVTSELANVYMGGNSPTDHALGLAAKNLQANWTKDQLKAALDLSRKNLQIRSNSMKNVGVAGASAGNPYAPQQTVNPTMRYNPATGKVEPIK